MSTDNPDKPRTPADPHPDHSDDDDDADAEDDGPASAFRCDTCGKFVAVNLLGNHAAAHERHEDDAGSVGFTNVNNPNPDEWWEP